MDYTRGIVCALLAAATASLVGIFAKIGMRDVPVLLATALRSVIMMVICVIIAGVYGMHTKLHTLHKNAVIMIVLAGVAGALSWVFGFMAYDLIGISKAYPIDKLSVPLAVVLAVIFLGERPTVTNWVGVALICVGAFFATYKPT
jgi:transporter family protein